MPQSRVRQRRGALTTPSRPRKTSKKLTRKPQKKLLPLTGYVHGGCSPVGMKKPFPTWIDETALLTDAFFCSAGRLGAQIGIDPEALAGYIGAQFADLTEE